MLAFCEAVCSAGKAVARVRSGEDSLPCTSSGDAMRLWTPLAVLGVLVGVLYASIVAGLVRDWLQDANYSYGLLIVPVAAFLIWRRRKELKRIPICPSYWGYAAVLGAMAMLVVGRLGAEVFLSRVSLIVLVSGMVLYFGGWRWLRTLTFPLSILFLMIPLPAIVFNQISLPLQFVSSRLATWFLAFSGVPVLREGNIIHLPAMSLDVAQACSGIRSVISLLALAIIYGYLMERAVWKRLVLGWISVPIAVFTNAARIMGTGIMAQYWSRRMATGFFHEFSGWLIFVFALVLLFVFHIALGFRYASASQV